MSKQGPKWSADDVSEFRRVWQRWTVQDLRKEHGYSPTQVYDDYVAELGQRVAMLEQKVKELEASKFHAGVKGEGER